MKDLRILSDKDRASLFVSSELPQHPRRHVAVTAGKHIFALCAGRSCAYLKHIIADRFIIPD